MEFTISNPKNSKSLIAEQRATKVGSTMQLWYSYLGENERSVLTRLKDQIWECKQVLTAEAKRTEVVKQ